MNNDERDRNEISINLSTENLSSSKSHRLDVCTRRVSIVIFSFLFSRSTVIVVVPHISYMNYGPLLVQLVWLFCCYILRCESVRRNCKFRSFLSTAKHCCLWVESSRVKWSQNNENCRCNFDCFWYLFVYLFSHWIALT